MNIEDVENLAQLARIDLKTEEKEEILTDLESILDYVRQIEKVPTQDIKQDIALQNVWREDLPAVADESSFSLELIVKQFPNSQNGFLKVKKIL